MSYQWCFFLYFTQTHSDVSVISRRPEAEAQTFLPVSFVSRPVNQPSFSLPARLFLPLFRTDLFTTRFLFLGLFHFLFFTLYLFFSSLFSSKSNSRDFCCLTAACSVFRPLVRIALRELSVHWRDHCEALAGTWPVFIRKACFESSRLIWRDRWWWRWRRVFVCCMCAPCCQLMFPPVCLIQGRVWSW